MHMCNMIYVSCIILDSKKKLIKKCENDRRICEQRMEEVTEKLNKTQKEYDRISKQIHDNLDLSIELANEKSQYTKTSNIEQASLDKHKSTLFEYEKTKEGLKLAVKKYRDFESSNTQNIKTLKEKYNAQWQEFEKNWYKWKIEEISMYLNYKLVTMGKIAQKTLTTTVKEDNSNDEKKSDEFETNEIDWNKFEENLKEEKFKSKYLDRIDKSELKSFGIQSYGHRVEIYNIIQNVCKNNPIPIETHGDYDVECEGEGQVMTSLNGVNDDGMQENKHIDSKYLCPLTKKVMLNPVIAFDGECYEKEAIISYLRKYKESPTTKETIDDVEWVIELLVENTHLKDKIQEKGLM